MVRAGQEDKGKSMRDWEEAAAAEPVVNFALEAVSTFYMFRYYANRSRSYNDS